MDTLIRVVIIEYVLCFVAIDFVGVIFTIVVVVANPALLNAQTISALELIGCTVVTGPCKKKLLIY